MKTKIPTIAFTLGLMINLTSVAQAGSSLVKLKFVKPLRCGELSQLPPALSCVFQVACNQKLIEVIRRDSIESQTEKTLIRIGGLVEEDSSLDCGDAYSEVSVSAGSTFSGRQYEIQFIENSSIEQKPADGTSSSTGD